MKKLSELSSEMYVELQETINTKLEEIAREGILYGLELCDKNIDEDEKYQLLAWKAQRIAKGPHYNSILIAEIVAYYLSRES